MPRRRVPENVPEVAEAILRLYRDDPKRWIKDEYAMTAKHNLTTFDSSHARCWCLMGACYRVTGLHNDTWDETPLIREFKNQMKQATGLSVLDFNDATNTRFRHVRSALRKLSRSGKSRR